jgi:ribosomal protein S12 methylthiotransferase
VKDRRTRPLDRSTARPLVCVVFLGCPKNQVDSENLLGSMSRAGYAVTSDPRAADVVVVTTCAFLGSAVAESESAIRRVLRLKRLRPALRVVVAGCLVQRHGRELARRFPGVDLWAGLDEMPDIPRLLNLRTGFWCTAAPRSLPARDAPRVHSSPPHYAWLKLADGCDNRCSYCTIPSIRGRLRSRTIPDVVAEARELARAGVKELLLVAQDTTAFGIDRGEPELARLLAELGRINRLRWLRLMYAHPAHLTNDVIAQFESNPKLCRYLDLPVQHISTRILRKMNRRYTRTRLLRLLARLRRVPDLRLRTTVITGFPGETPAEFRELLGFVRTARFDRLSGYTYSTEPGTQAASMSGQVPALTRSSRLHRVMQLQARISRARLRELVGRELDVIVDSPGTGRTQWDAPEVDGVVRLLDANPEPGSFVRCRVVRSSTHDLSARVL